MPGVNPYPTLSGRNEIHANNEAVSMFRASPWVTYEPTNGQGQSTHSRGMDQDVDMDAPQISTLREEETPPPQPKSTSVRRGKVVHKPPPWTRPRGAETHTDDEYGEVEEEEDQLIDDDDDMMKPVLPASLLPSGRSTDTTPKRKTTGKRKPRKSDKRSAEDGRKVQENAIISGHTDILNLAPPPTITWFEPAPSGNHADAAQEDVKQVKLNGTGELSKATTPNKAPRKPATLRAKKVLAKPKTALPILADDTGIVSEGYTGTAASSPVTVQLEANSPEPEPEHTGTLVPTPLIEETNLENVPLPAYPLPTKPFPVQPPPKITTGFAPNIPLDKSHKKVRHWRVAYREIRGIAGGRWFARSWVGMKDSEYGNVLASGQKNSEDKVSSGVALPRLSAVSISAPPSGKGSGKGKSLKTISSLGASAAPSRSGSSVPDVPPTGPRAPTKMRTIIGPPSEGGDSDMAAPGS